MFQEHARHVYVYVYVHMYMFVKLLYIYISYFHLYVQNDTICTSILLYVTL